MSENKKKSGVRTDLSPSEFAKGLDKVENKDAKRSKSFKNGFKKLNYILSALGFIPMLTSNSGIKTDRTNTHVSDTPHLANSFKENHHVDTQSTKQFDAEQAYIKKKQEEEYLQSAGFKRDDLLLTEEDHIKRKQEDAYFNSLPGHSKKDSGRDDER